MAGGILSRGERTADGGKDTEWAGEPVWTVIPTQMVSLVADCVKNEGASVDAAGRTVWHLPCGGGTIRLLIL